MLRWLIKLYQNRVILNCVLLPYYVGLLRDCEGQLNRRQSKCSVLKKLPYMHATKQHIFLKNTTNVRDNNVSKVNGS